MPLAAHDHMQTAGPSFTSSVCPKFTPLTMFANNVAHSNDFYGLRIFPEYYPDEFPCNFASNHSVPAVFQSAPF